MPSKKVPDSVRCDALMLKLRTGTLEYHVYGWEMTVNLLWQVSGKFRTSSNDKLNAMTIMVHCPVDRGDWRVWRKGWDSANFLLFSEVKYRFQQTNQALLAPTNSLLLHYKKGQF